MPHRLLLLALTLFACTDDKGGNGDSVAPDDSQPDTGPDVIDADGDGVISTVDCDDGDASVYPGAADGCDDVDNDCDGTVDEDAVGGAVWFVDGDGDGSGDAGTTVYACDAPEGYVANADDCDDSDAAIAPGAADGCDGRDNNCDGAVDEGAPYDLWYQDADSDGYGGLDVVAYACAQPDGYVANASDCDDVSDAISPDAVETCDGVDNNCNGYIDDSPTDSVTVYLDYDGDGYGNPDYADSFCTSEEGYIEEGGDCDDLSASTYPGADETCDGADNNCDGTTDESPIDGTVYYLDADADGYGGGGGTLMACDLPDGYGVDASDCDDSTGAVSPGLDEVCNDGIDNNCDGDGTGCGIEGTIGAADVDISFIGALSSDYLGRSGDAGDVDGDGQADLVLGASGLESGTTYSVGGAYLVLGPVTAGGSIGGAAAALVLGPLGTGYTYGGWAVAAPDLDGDGAAELLNAAYSASTSKGEVAIFTGGAGLSGVLAATDADATISGGATYDYLGYSMARAGDANGDGLQDVLIGAYGNDTAASSAGAAYLFAGDAAGFSGALTTTDADVTVLGGSASAYLGWAVDSAGDVNGDGVDDLLVGAYYFDTTTSDVGAGLLFLGASGLSGTLASADYDAALVGTVAYDYAGGKVSGAGDTDGDGYADFLVGAGGATSGTVTDGGAAWLTLGSATGPSGLVTPDATLTGTTSYDYLGEAVGEAGDLNDDGLDDVVVGAYGEDSGYSGAGAAYLFLGPVSGTVAASAADAKLTGPSGGDGYVGRTLIGPVDADGDGAMDLVTGGYYVDTAAYDAGAVYVLPGGGM